MRIKNIASGSSGNATYIGTDSTHILIDAGLSRKRIVQGLDEVGLSLKDLDAILVTHEHVDHISGIGVIERSVDVPIYATRGTLNGISMNRSLGVFDWDVFCEIIPDRPFEIGDISIEPLHIYHDAADPVCFRLENDGKSFALVTDLGEYDDYLLSHLKGLDGILLEANHDVRMLEVGPYPYPLKQRILGRYGHLSNESSGRLLAEVLHDNIKYIMLGHLSRENNTRDLARLAVETEIDTADNIYSGRDFEIHVAYRDMPSALAEI